ncbi:MAG TPA: DUF2333 family protein [Candidatus Binataceae bacterium]|nr:DUF2333 family protein [Candidatus Binataceae bacterium]
MSSPSPESASAAPPPAPKRIHHYLPRSKTSLIIVAALVVWAAIILGLHFGQTSHDRLGFDIDQTFPPGKPFAPGEIYATTMAEIMDHELKGGFGWRPNDIFLWGPTLMADNNSNRQIGILIALRETCRVFKDHLTKISSNEYDQNLVLADSDFRNDPYRWMLPAAETKYRSGVRRLRAYVAGLHRNPPISRELNQRNIELVRLMQAWSDLLGDAHANLYRTRSDNGDPVRPWTVDNYFYEAQGYAHVMYYMMQAVKREYYVPLRTKPVLARLFDEALDPLGKAAMMKPLIVLDGSPDGIFANSRRNLDAYISEARQKIYSIREELSQ